ncbi:interleukin-17 receptor C-like [Struthio camelus]|uniref:interleukin-17 receptor C-like n=1 Tax=Struthio camelus TaxID=8801 RepID=UPI003603E137
MGAPGLALLVLAGLAAVGRCAPRDALTCSQGLACRLLDADALCGLEAPRSGPGLVPTRLRLEPALRCTGAADCSPCLRARLQLALEPAAGPGPPPTSTPRRRESPPGTAVAGILLLSGHAYASSRCVAVEVRALRRRPGDTLGSVTFKCFEAALGSELHVTAYTDAGSRRRLSRSRRVPDCSWPAAQAAVPLCRVPRLQVSRGPKEAVVQVQEAVAGHGYTLRLYQNRSHGAGGSGRAVTASGAMNYSLPADEVLPCLCLQVWPEIQDPPRASMCPFSHDAEAWERLWARTRLALHDTGDSLTCSVSAPCDLPAELVPCWRPEPAGPCQALPHLQQPVAAEGPQEFRALRPHPNLCVQARSGGQVRLTECLRDRALPGRVDDLLLLESRGPGGNASLCALERGTCTPLASFTSTGAGRPGLLEQRLRQDVATGQCAQVWHGENGTGAALWACPLHKYLHARWALAWMAALLGAACLLLLLLLKKEDVKGWLKTLRADRSAEGPLRGRRALVLHAAEPVAERAACALAAALRPLGLAVTAAPGGGEAAAAGPLPWLHAQHGRALRGGDTVVLLLSPAAAAAARRWADEEEDGGSGGVEGARPCEAFAAALSCALPALAAGAGRYVVARLEAAVPAVPPALRRAPAFALPSQTGAFLRALAGPGRRRRRLEPHVAPVAARLQRALAAGRGGGGGGEAGTLLLLGLAAAGGAGGAGGPGAEPEPEPEPCRACRGLADSFSRGLERTEREGFGGGNTAWEEEKLAKYEHSETRLLEVLESVCAPSDFACHQLLERAEEHVERWWFHERQQHPDFFRRLCVEQLAVCCPAGTYGPECLPCAGGPRQPCSGNGRCDGDGTRRGTGLCVCGPGYGGPFCSECGDGYYEAARNKSHLVCAECYWACGRCTGPEDSSCLRCKRGWVLHERRCIDVDECGTEMAHCRANQFCVNTEGSYECRDCSTACIGCMGAGPARCKKCNKGYRRDGAKCLDVDECASAEEPVCAGAREVCENTEGSYRCVCAPGHLRRDGQCVEDEPPDAPEKGFFDDVTEDEVVVLQQMFFGVVICALATLAAKGDMVFTAIFIGAVAAMAGYWLSDRGDRVLDGFMKGR